MMSEATFIKKLCSNNGSMRYDDLVNGLATDIFLGDGYVAFNDDTSCLENSDMFLIDQSTGDKRVIAKTKVRVCKARDCVAPGCVNLHLCKKFLLGDCPFGRGRKPCRFGHDLMSPHNAQVLGASNLLLLDRAELCVLLMQNDTSFLPPVCYNYNNGPGQYGRCEEAEGCRRLHICERYLRGDCSCPRAHDFLEPHPLRTLQDRWVPMSLMASMKDIYSNIEAMRGRNRGRPPPSSMSAGPGARNHAGRGGGAGGSNQAGGCRPPEATRDKTEICLFFVKGHCKHDDSKCYKAHSALPYRWEVCDGQSWSPLADNEKIEEDYCNPAKIYSKGVEPVCFDTMTRGLRRVRRLSTVSSVLQPTFVLTTQWAWHWEDEHGNWIQYASAAGGHSFASITSEDLEQKYLQDPNAVMEFTAGSQTYELSLPDMIQTNKRYGTKKLVRRRPVFVSAADAQQIKTSKKAPNRSNFKAVPSHWDQAQTPETGYKRVAVQSGSSEYREILNLFSSTMRGVNIVSIERIQNKSLWEVYQWQKEQMKKSNAGRNVLEKQLFHGTDSKHIDAICHHNFDWRICGTHGTAYGKGSYFARDAKYSHSYTADSASGRRCMFVCRILAGHYTSGDPSYLRPPSKDGGDTVFYDSCVNDFHNPSIFVIFEKHQVYPEYLIQYGEGYTTATATATATAPAYAQPRITTRPTPTPRATPVFTSNPAPAAYSYSYASSSASARPSSSAQPPTAAAYASSSSSSSRNTTYYVPSSPSARSTSPRSKPQDNKCVIS